MRPPLPVLALLASLGATAAQAGPAPLDPIRAVAFRSAPSGLGASFPATEAPATPTGADALPKRSLDVRFAPKDVTGSVGFLCGREPGQSHTGSASAFGHDPHGRFLGAKLSRAF